jgi:hypothetical protein
MPRDEIPDPRIITYKLVMYVEVPESSGLHISNLSSPIVTLGHYEGLSSDIDAPEWTRMPPGIPVSLRQPRDAIADVFAELAFWPENVSVVCIFASHKQF